MCEFYKRLKNGFTLIELLIVIVLLGILSGVLYSVVNPETSRNAAKSSIKIVNISKIVDAVETYASLEGEYPETEADLIGSEYVLNWPDGEPSATDTYEYRYDEDSGFYTISTDNTSNSFSGAFTSTDATYLVYSSQPEGLLECPASQLSGDCVGLSGDEFIPPCVSPGGACEESSICCREAPFCSNDACSTCVSAGGDCEDGDDCCSSAPYCISDACATCKPAGYECNNASECCAGVPLCPEGFCVSCLALGQSCSVGGDCCGTNVCTGGTCSIPCASEGALCTQSSDCCSSAPYCISDSCTTCKPVGHECSDASECCSSAPYCVSNVCVGEYNVALHKPIIDSGGTLAWYYGATFVERITDGDRSSGCVTQTNRYYDPGRFLIDLQGEFTINRVIFKYGWDSRFCPVDFRISYSNKTSVQMDDSSDWIIVYTADDQNRVWIEHSFSPLNARYIKAEYPPIGCWGGWGSDYEVEVYGHQL